MKNNEIITEAFVLRSSPYKENSRSITFLTKDHGVISTVKHGFTSKKNTGRSILEVMNRIRITLSLERKRYKIMDFDLIENYPDIRNNYTKIDTVLGIFSKLNKLPLNDLDGNIMIFHLVDRFLGSVNSNYNYSRNNTEIYFYYKLAWCMGIELNVSNECSVCNKEDDTFYLDISSGGIICKKCKTNYEYALQISEPVSKFLKKINNIKFSELNSLPSVKNFTKKEFFKIYNIYTDFHLNLHIL